ncbi:Isocitrate dehydrogenase [NAD] catalytic subunit 5 [Arachis hypogaea]|nr:Isocitrate dehydrogenase [NAD] catalytic subunit 5 [Arachis hypogaea]
MLKLIFPTVTAPIKVVNKADVVKNAALFNFFHFGKQILEATILSPGIIVLRHLSLHDKADQIHNAILNTIAEGKYRTADLGGKAKTTEFANEIIDHLLSRQGIAAHYGALRIL